MASNHPAFSITMVPSRVANQDLLRRYIGYAFYGRAIDSRRAGAEKVIHRWISADGAFKKFYRF
jgi:hypothetical protein